MTESLPASTSIGAVHLTVSDLDRSVAFYTERLGFALRARGAGSARLGAGGPDLLVLVGDRAARRVRGTTGLYHFAILVPTRGDLGRSLGRLAETRTHLSGAADHGVSEALYLPDPDGNGIEIYRDRERSEWPFEDGRLAMVTQPLDLEGVAATPSALPESAGLDPGTRIGHVHLHVADLGAAHRFYVETLGFSETQRYGPGALFVAAGGYHHHVGLNTWQGVGAPAPPADALGLRSFELVIPSEDVEGRRECLAHAGIPIERRDDGFLVRDPSGNGLLVRAA